MSCAKMAKLIEMPFAAWTRVGQGSICQMAVQIDATHEYD